MGQVLHNSPVLSLLLKLQMGGKIVLYKTNCSVKHDVVLSLKEPQEC